MFVRDCARRTIRLVANEPDDRDAEEYVDKIRQIRRDHDLPPDADVIFVEVTVADPSDFEGRLDVHGEVLHEPLPGADRASRPSVPNALAALAAARSATDTGVHAAHLLRVDRGQPGRASSCGSCCFGVGEVAPVTREVLRRAEPDRARRPHVHVG